LNSDIQIRVFGSLQNARPTSSEKEFRMVLHAPAPLGTILARWGIPEDRIQLVLVNHRAVSKNSIIRPGDRVSLFPEEYAIFADWKDFRK
jgi:hypothetical protein